MRRLVPILAAWAGIFCVTVGPRGGQAASLGRQAESDDTPALERVELFDHAPYEGLIESEDDAWITMIQIKRLPGQPMHLVIRPIDRRLVSAVVRLEPAQKAKLRQEIERFRNRAAIEAGRMEAVGLEPFAAEGNHYQRYRGKWFTLDSTADEATTRRLIVRTEQIFAAYRQILPPRTAPKESPRLVVFGAMGEYQAFLARLGLKIHNRACFIGDKNTVATGTELARLVSLMAKINTQNEQLRRQLKDLEKRLSDRLREVGDRLKRDGLPNNEIARLLTLERRKFEEQNKKLRDELSRSDRESAKIFNQNTRQTFARLYHESFHAYLENYVYPHRQYNVPNWLNEGLAVMFEGGMLDGDTLRVDAPNVVALKKLKEDLNGEQPLPLEKLLAAGQADFLPTNEAAQTAADRYYVHAWGLAYYVTFEKRLLGHPSLLRYVQPAEPAAEVAQRFQQLVDLPLDRFDKEWREYILALRNRP